MSVTEAEIVRTWVTGHCSAGNHQHCRHVAVTPKGVELRCHCRCHDREQRLW